MNISIYIKIILNKNCKNMSKERDIQILEHKISETEKKILKFEELKISDKKIQKLEIMKLKYENQLEELLYA